VRYCIIRHACFLAGLGRPAGDPDAPAQAVEQITSLLRRPVAPAMLEAALRRLEAIPGPVAMPDPGTQLEADLFDALAVIFLDAEQAARARAAELNQVLAAQLNGGTPRLTVDLSGLRFADSAAIRELIRAHRAITQRGGTLELTRPQQAVARVPILLGVD
jgi:anti-anti-sigma factor